MKKIVCDASSLISMSDNCLLCILKKMNINLIASKGVEDEIIKNPIHTKRFQLKAIQLRGFEEKQYLKIIKNPEIEKESDKIINLANSLLQIKGKHIKILHKGEAESIALYRKIKADALLIDERTARHLIEDPDKIRQYMQSRMNRKVNINKSVMQELEKELSGINIIRSAEIVAYAYEKGILEKCGMKNALEAGLYGVKLAGCSITKEEIEEYLKLLG